jgi:hypothetical protein
MAAEVRKALIVALDVITWPEIIAIQLDLARVNTCTQSNYREPLC